MKLLKAVIENFRLFKAEEFNFTDQTVIRGMNGGGKSSVVEAIAWCLYGTNILGKAKADSVLMRSGAKSMRVLTAWRQLDGSTYTIERNKPAKGTVSVLVNGTLATPGQVEGLFFATVQEFLSVFVPGFFSSLEPKDGKAILARHSEISSEEIVGLLLPAHQEILANVQFGMGFDSVEIFRKKVSTELKEAQSELLRLEGEVRAAGETIKAGAPEPFVSKITDELRAKAENLRKILSEHDLPTKTREQSLEALSRQRDMLRKSYKTLLGGLINLESVQTTCPTCGQDLPQEHVEQTIINIKEKNKETEIQLAQLKEQGEAIKKNLEALQTEDTEQIVHMRDWLARYDAGENQEKTALAEYQARLKVFEESQSMLSKKQQWVEAQKEVIKDLEEKIAAVKEFRFEFVRQQQKKLDALFDKVHVALSKVTTDGEIKEAFQIDWDGKPYQTLSTSEKVRCDLEVGRAIARLAGKDPFPAFVDDAEGVQGLFEEALGRQIIAAYVFFCELMVQPRETAVADLEAELRQILSLVRGGVSQPRSSELKKRGA